MPWITIERASDRVEIERIISDLVSVDGDGMGIDGVASDGLGIFWNATVCS